MKFKKYHKIQTYDNTVSKYLEHVQIKITCLDQNNNSGVNLSINLKKHNNDYGI